MSTNMCCIQADAINQEKGIISTVWEHLEDLLTSPGKEACIGSLAQALPSLDALELQQLPALAKLHLSSASNMMTTIRLLAPAAFAGEDQAPSLDLLMELDCSASAMVAALIDLQLFHFKRAAALMARSRAWLSQRRGCCDCDGASSGVTHADMGSTGGSSSSGAGSSASVHISALHGCDTSV